MNRLVLFLVVLAGAVYGIPHLQNTMQISVPNVSANIIYHLIIAAVAIILFIIATPSPPKIK